MRYNYTWSEQQNGTFDVDSWGTSANAVEKDYSHAGSGSLISSLSPTVLNEFRFQFAREYRPRPYDGPDITGQSRPLPDTAFDFGRGYRFGEPFFIPVDYYDQRIQFNDNISLIKGRHAFKAGIEYNGVKSVQTFVGFANGRYIFSSTDGFLNYARNPRYVECSNGTTSQNGQCPAGANISGPVLLYLQQAGVGGLSVEEAGTQSIPQKSLALFLQDKWQPSAASPSSTACAGKASSEPDVITPADQVFFSGVHRQDGHQQPRHLRLPLGRQHPLRLDDVPAARRHLLGSARRTARRCSASTAASSTGASPAWPSPPPARPTAAAGRRSSATARSPGSSVRVPAYPNIIPASQIGSPVRARRLRVRQGLPEPAHVPGLGRRWSGRSATTCPPSSSTTTPPAAHITRWLNSNDASTTAAPGPAASTAGPTASARSGRSSSTAKSNYDGLTFGLTKRLSHNYEFQVNYTLSWDKSDDDNERDPFTLRYARISRARPGVRLLRPRPAAPPERLLPLAGPGATST